MAESEVERAEGGRERGMNGGEPRLLAVDARDSPAHELLEVPRVGRLGVGATSVELAELCRAGDFALDALLQRAQLLGRLAAHLF